MERLMGLVAETVRVNPNAAITSAIATAGLPIGTTIAAWDACVVQTEGSSSSGYENAKAIDSSIYRILSMQSDMKTLTTPIVIKSEFDRFLQEAIALTNGEPVAVGFDFINKYLGSLGVSTYNCTPTMVPV